MRRPDPGSANWLPLRSLLRLIAFARSRGHRGRLPPFPVVEVEWVDAWNVAAGWHDVSSLSDGAHDVIRAFSAGYLIVASPEVLIVAVALSDDYSQASGGIIVIPRRAVVAFRHLRH